MSVSDRVTRNARRRAPRRPVAAGVPAGLALSRRDFLRTGALAGTGLVLAFHVPALVEAAVQRAGGKAAFAPNAWLRIAPDDTVTVIIARSEMGQGSSTGLALLVAEELHADWRKVRIETAIPGPKYGDMGTGGSRSIRSLFDPLRTAGAQAREMLIAAAAQEWKVAKEACRAENGEVVGPGGRRLAYGALAVAAAKLPVPENPPLEERKDWRFIGTSPARLDGPDKVDGKTVFGIDVKVPGMLYAVVARCPVFGGKLTSFDAAKARAVAGVRAVAAISSGVAVIADSTWAALKGREALTVAWDEGALATLDSAAIAKKYAELAQQAGPVVRKEGAGAAALANAARTIEATYETPFLAHAPMEPMNCTAWVKKDSATIWVGSQDASGAQETAAKHLGLPPAAVTVHLLPLGGGFGRRAHQDFVIEAIEAAKAAGAPVKVMWTREDDVQHDRFRPATYHLLRAGLDAGGAPVAWLHRMVGPGIIAQFEPRVLQNGWDPSSVDVAENIPYAFPNLQVESILHDPGVPVWWWRSVAATQNAYAIECFLDEIAAAAKRDPFELRRELLKDKPRNRAVLEAAAKRAGWGTPLPAGQGRGIAVVESFGSYVAQVAEVEVAAGGGVRVKRVVCAVDCGTAVYPDMIVAQMESGIVYGLSAALHGEITIARGRVAQANFGDYPIVTIADCPVIEVELVPSGDAVGGIGEPGVPPITPAVANAVFAATGKPVRKLPIVGA
jgi:isoquinoline 1-oxidoreductase beta subunit